MPIIIRSKLDAKRVGSFTDEKTGKRDYAVLQFIERDEKNAIKLIEVNLPDGADHSPYVEGKMVELSISVSSSKTGKIYYRAIPPLEVPAAQPGR